MSELKQQNSEIKQTNIEVKAIGELLREEVATNKKMFESYVMQNNYDMEALKKRITNIAEGQKEIVTTLEAREDVYKVAKWLKWAIGIILAGMLTAGGAHLYNKWFIQPEKPKIEKPKQ